MRQGIRSALEILTEPSEAQRNVKERIVNRGRLVCLTYTEDLKSFTEHLSSILLQEVTEVNSVAAGSSNTITISQLDVVIKDKKCTYVCLVIQF